MKTFSKILIILLALAMLAGCLASCDGNGNEGATEAPSTEAPTTGGEENNNNGNTEPEFIDYASQVKFNPSSGRKYAEVTVYNYIDGDTTHFNINDPDFDGDVLKARYLGINTPESTGDIEPWGKKASNYTKGQLSQAVSIIIESDNATWNADSTGGRYLVWVWYKTAEDAEYRNLNMEILQQGLAFGSNASLNAYSTYTMGALNQAKQLKLHVFSKTEKDPDFYYGDAITLSLKQLKANCEKYEGKLVCFEAVVSKSVGATFYVEEYDAENDMYFGMQVFAGYGCPIISDFVVGNRVSIVGKLTYYENGGTYQISGLEYDILDRNWLGGCRVLSTGHSASYTEVDVPTLMDGKITLDTYVEVENTETGEIEEILEKKEFDYGELAHYSTLTMKNLTVQSVYTTVDSESSEGALTITCKDENGNTIKIRTASKLTVEENGEKIDITAADFPSGTVIASVKGIIDSFKGDYQIKVFSFDDITFA